MISAKFMVDRKVNRSPRAATISQLHFVHSTQKHSTESGPNATELVSDYPSVRRSYLESKQSALNRR